MKVVIVGYLRPEKNFDSLEALITAIKTDIADAEKLLEAPELQKLKTHEFFTLKGNKVVKSCSDDSLTASNGSVHTNTDKNGHT